MGAPGTKFRVFVVEDEPLLSMEIEDTIGKLGYSMVGPVAQLDEALILAEAGDFDCAILDVNIRGGKSYAVADILLKHGCPFLWTTGYSDWSLPMHLGGQNRLTKPYSMSELDHQLRRLCDRVELRRQNGPSPDL